MGPFIKGLSFKGLPEGYTTQDVIESIWVFDVKVGHRKRARFAARGDMEANSTEEGRYSPVIQMKTVRLILAVAAQLNLELVTVGFPKAFLLGKVDKSKPTYVFAPEGFALFDGEIWQICLPLYGPTISSRKFYESLSEFLRAIGFEHYGGGGPCLFRRARVLPALQQTFNNHVEARTFKLPGRPLKPLDKDKGSNLAGPEDLLPPALPRAPTPSRIGPPPRDSFRYPAYMDQPEYKPSPNVRFEPFHAGGLAPDASNGLFHNQL